MDVDSAPTREVDKTAQRQDPDARLRERQQLLRRLRELDQEPQDTPRAARSGQSQHPADVATYHIMSTRASAEAAVPASTS